MTATSPARLGVPGASGPRRPARARRSRWSWPRRTPPTGRIDHVEPGDGSLPGALLPARCRRPSRTSTPWPSASTTPCSRPTAEPAGEAEAVQRDDHPGHRHQLEHGRDNRIAEAQQAAKAFLDAAPDDVLVGLVTFAEHASRSRRSPRSTGPPRRGRSTGSRLVRPDPPLRRRRCEAVAASGTEGSRTVLVLSDGRDTADDPDRHASPRPIELARVKVDVVALGPVRGGHGPARPARGRRRRHRHHGRRPRGARPRSSPTRPRRSPTRSWSP